MVVGRGRCRRRCYVFDFFVKVTYNLLACYVECRLRTHLAVCCDRRAKVNARRRLSTDPNDDKKLYTIRHKVQHTQWHCCVTREL